MRTDDLSMIHGLAAAGLGYALTTAAAVDSRFRVTLHPTKQQLGMRRTFYIRSKSYAAPAVDALLAVLTELTSTLSTNE